MIEVRHIFTDGVYAKRVSMQAGDSFSKHRHSFDHLSIVAKGMISVKCEGEETIYSSGDDVCISAGVEHEIEAITNAVWFCIHATDEKDPDNIDHVLTGE